MADVVFSDEVSVCVGSDAKVHIYRPVGMRYHEEYLNLIWRSGRFSVNLWGFLTARGLGKLNRVEGHLDRFQYLDILEHVMKPSVLDYHYLDGLFGCVQDRSPIHTANVVTEWFSTTHPEIQLLDWPAKGADMNPIENVWALLKKRLNRDGVRNADELWDRIQVTWNELRNNPNLVPNLVNSMPRRIQSVDKQGGWTKY